MPTNPQTRSVPEIGDSGFKRVGIERRPSVKKDLIQQIHQNLKLKVDIQYVRRVSKVATTDRTGLLIRTIILWFFPWDTVSIVKAGIESETAIPPASQRLWLKAEEIGRTVNKSLHQLGMTEFKGNKLFLIEQSEDQGDGSWVIRKHGPCLPLHDDQTAPLINRIQRGLDAKVKPTLASEGTSGTYFLRDEKGERVACFKPEDEEFGCVNNPRGRCEEQGREGVSIGKAGIREIAAYLIDHKGFHGVPRTTRVEVKAGIDEFHWAKKPSQPRFKVGSLQEFVSFDDSAEDLGFSKFPVREVHKIAMLDIRLLNLDRNISNILVKCPFGRPLQLVPIDHGFSLPERLSKVGLPRGTTSATVDWCWTDWPQAKIPLDPFAVKYLREIDIDADCERLREELGIPEGSLANMRLAHIILLKAAKFKVSLYRLAQLFTRRDFDKPSELENLCSNAEKLALNQLPRMMRGDDFMKTRIDSKGQFRPSRKVATFTSPKLSETVRGPVAFSHSLQTSPLVEQPFLDITDDIFAANCVLGPNRRSLSPHFKSARLHCSSPRERLAASLAKSKQAEGQGLVVRCKAANPNSLDDSDPSTSPPNQQEVTTTTARSFSFGSPKGILRNPSYTCWKVAERIPEPLNLYQEKVLEAKFSPNTQSNYSCDELERLSLSPNNFSLQDCCDEGHIPRSTSLIDINTSTVKAHSVSAIDLVIKHSDDNSYGGRRHQTITELDLDADSLRRHMKTVASPTPTPNLNPITGSVLDGFSLGSPRTHRKPGTYHLGISTQDPRIPPRQISAPELGKRCWTPKHGPCTVPGAKRLVSEDITGLKLRDDGVQPIFERFGHRLMLNKLFFLFLDRLTDLHLQKIMQQELKQNETEQEQSDDEETPETLFHWRNAMKKLNNPIKPSAMNHPLLRDNSSDELELVKKAPRIALTEYTSSRSDYDDFGFSRSGSSEDSASARSGLDSPEQFSCHSNGAQSLSSPSSISGDSESTLE